MDESEATRQLLLFTRSSNTHNLRPSGDVVESFDEGVGPVGFGVVEVEVLLGKLFERVG